MRAYQRPTFILPAFTILELLVVVSIIALLVGILLPALGNARHVARSSQSLSNLHQQGVALHSFASQNKGYYPRHSSLTPPHPRSWQAEGHPARMRHPDYLWEFMPSAAVWVSPILTGKELDIVKQPFAYSPGDTFGGYGYNFQYLGNARAGTTGLDGSVLSDMPYVAHQDKSVRRPSATIAIADCSGSRKGLASNVAGVGGEAVYSLDPPLPSYAMGSRGNKQATAGPYYTTGLSGSKDGEAGGQTLGSSTWLYRSFLADRNHGRTANALLLDGHAEAKPSAEWDDSNGDGIFDNGYYNGLGRAHAASIPGSSFQSER